MHIQLAAGSLITAETSERRFTTGSLGSEYHSRWRTARQARGGQNRAPAVPRCLAQSGHSRPALN
jgi:hypothetical protein